MDFKYIKRNNGITIIALTVTIIVMLILASISINIVIGDGGLLDQMKDTSERTDNVINSDESHLNVMAYAKQDCNLLKYAFNKINDKKALNEYVINIPEIICPNEEMADFIDRNKGKILWLDKYKEEERE